MKLFFDLVNNKNNFTFSPWNLVHWSNRNGRKITALVVVIVTGGQHLTLQLQVDDLLLGSYRDKPCKLK